MHSRGWAWLPVTLGLAACDSTFEPASELTTVRVLAVRVDTPYAAPGSTVAAEVLAHDGRKNDGGRPMKVQWLAEPCVAPADDEVADCYRRSAQSLPRDADLTPYLVDGPTASFEMPADAVAAGPMRPGQTPYTTVFLFSSACAGTLRMVGPRETYPDEVPFACLDGEGRRLGKEDFVFAFARVLVSTELRNSNPSISAVKLDGKALEEGVPFVVPRCEKAAIEDCPGRDVTVEVPAGTSEVDPTSAIGDREPLREQIWASFYATGGELESEAVILFDSDGGKVDGAKNILRGPRSAGLVDFFVVTHDSRSGVTWKKLQLDVK